MSYFVRHPARDDDIAVFMPTADPRRWIFTLSVDPCDETALSALTPTRSLELLRAAAGIGDLYAVVEPPTTWTIAASVSRTWRCGRVFLAGDAAHVVPPLGAFGANLGIGDAANLAWKLAAVLHGWAAPGLLDSYQDERLPVARHTMREAHAAAVQRSERVVPFPRGSLGLLLGTRYRSGAVLPDGTPAPVADDPVATYVPGGAPGTRLPNLAAPGSGATAGGAGPRDLVDDHDLVQGTLPSVLDLLGPGLTLLTPGEGHPWAPAVAAARREREVPLTLLTLDPGGAQRTAEHDLACAAARDVLGCEASGAVLVRPDGVIAWRTPAAPSDPAAVLGDALTTLLGPGAAKDASQPEEPRWRQQTSANGR